MAKSQKAPQSDSAYITPEGFARLQSEHDHLWSVERPKVTEQVSVAAALGDRSENADYIYGKKRLREIDRRIRFLAKRIDALTVVESDSERKDDRIYFGAWVTLEDADGETLSYRLVGPDESDASRGEISMDSPVGRSLLGKSVGDEVIVRRPRGALELEVIAVRYGAADPAEG
ncbi:MAG: transcription elongation factor GreB [Deltaproteobacteria bacterium]|nr:transcription elongation factor GreB [Deltaproteobacteria bacterium]